MIILTTPSQINSVLGGDVPIDIDKLVLSPFTLQPHTTNRIITGQLKLSSSANPSMPEIVGNMSINLLTDIIEVVVPQLDFYQKKSLNAAQRTAVQTIIDNAQNSLETGLIVLGIVAGVQSTGAL